MFTGCVQHKRTKQKKQKNVTVHVFKGVDNNDTDNIADDILVWYYILYGQNNTYYYYTTTTPTIFSSTAGWTKTVGSPIASLSNYKEEESIKENLDDLPDDLQNEINSDEIVETEVETYENDPDGYYDEAEHGGGEDAGYEDNSSDDGGFDSGDSGFDAGDSGGGDGGDF
jgi:hypothetical protein